MTMKAVMTPNSEDRVQNQTQKALQKGLTDLSSKPLNSGQILSSVKLTSGNNDIAHGLNRTLIGWFLVRIRSAATVFDNQDSNKSPNKTLSLNASADVTVDIYVF